MSRKKLGEWGEKKAFKYLKDKGFEILEKNYRVKIGEIDIIAKKDNYIVFVEVKTRKSLKYGNPEYAVNRHKQDKIKKVAELYLLKNNYYDKNIRFDVITIIIDRGKSKLNHIRAAF